MKTQYSDCFYCGGSVEERPMTRELRWKSKLYLIENVPVGVCVQCGEQFVMPSVAKSVDLFLAQQRKPSKTIQVPVYEYSTAHSFS